MFNLPAIVTSQGSVATDKSYHENTKDEKIINFK